MNWNKLKLDVLYDLQTAKVKGEAARCIMKFERRVNTCRNMLNHGSTWEMVTYSKAYSDARKSLSLLNECGDYNMKTAKFYNEFSEYCKARGLKSAKLNLGDCLC